MTVTSDLDLISESYISFHHFCRHTDCVLLLDNGVCMEWGHVHLQNGLEAGLVVVHVLLHLSALHVKDVDQYLHIAEHIVPLCGEVVLHEYLLPGGREEGERSQSLVDYNQDTSFLSI